jgi:AbiA family abortive infection protein
MFAFDYEDWKIVCSQIFAQRYGRKKYYLQWYPFSKLSIKEKNDILSREYFNNFINNGLFLFYPETWLLCNNYILKGDGNFRNASLVSPLFYLLFLTLGKRISKYFQSERQADILVFYAGNYTNDRYYYEKEYDAFYKCVNNLSQHYSYYLKTDIKDFFSNINVNKLFNIISNGINKQNVSLSQREMFIYKELLLYLGQGEFPLIENSVASSFLSTIVYLEKPDMNLHWFLTNKETSIKEFVMIRYVDDLYILFNSDIQCDKLPPVLNRIMNYYSSELKMLNLSLNRNKTIFKKTNEISNELKKSPYEEKYNKKKFNITNFINKTVLINFLERLKYSLNKCELDVNKYTEIVNEVFAIENMEYNPQVVFNSLVFQDHLLFRDEIFIERILEIVNDDYNFLKLDPKRLVIILLNTKNEVLIKTFLDKLFKSQKNNTWDVYDTSLIITYFMQRGFQHKDLLNVLRGKERNIFNYYLLFCDKSFVFSYLHQKNSFIKLFHDNVFYKNDGKLFFFYFMYKIEFQKNNYLAAFAYFKNFFDRISAHIAFRFLSDESKGKPNYKKYYKECSFRKLYSDIENSEPIIKKAHEIRNENPLSHSSAELLDSDNTENDIINSIKGLTFLITRKIEMFTIIPMGKLVSCQE